MRCPPFYSFLTVPLSAVLLLAYSSAAMANGEQTAAGANAFIALVYHEVRSDVRDYPDPYAVDDAALVAQFAWLRGNGYSPVSVDQIVTARAGGKALPPKSVLLTFDDAYLSFYTRVYPLLREFQYPAVVAVVGSWIDTPPGVLVHFGEKDTVSRASFPSWRQLREMADSGLVEVASHSYDLHHGVIANPQGNLQPAATARVYDAATGGYETDADWRQRVHADLTRNAALIERETGHRPRAVAWPYGSYNDELAQMALGLGSPVTLTLDDGVNSVDAPLNAVRRIVVGHNPSLADFADAVRGPQYPAPLRALQVKLDDVYDADPARQEVNLSALLDRIQVLKPTEVFLQAYSEMNGDGIARVVYFPNRHLAMRADLFNRVAWQITTRTDASVFALLPVMAFHLPPDIVNDIYEDLAQHVNFAGLLFDDQIGIDAADTAMVSAALEFTQQLAARVRAFRAPIKVARSLDVGPIVTLANKMKFSHELARLLASSDQVVLNVSPSDGIADAALANMTARIIRLNRESGRPDDARKIIFMLSAAHDSADNTLQQQMRSLQLGSMLNFGYRSNDFRHDQATLINIAPALSLRTFPLPPDRIAR